MTRDQILQAAEKCVCGGRNGDYGEPERNFRKISELWSTYMGFNITEIDVAKIKVLLKAARVATGKGTEDCFVDIAGYAACAGEIATLIMKGGYTE